MATLLIDDNPLQVLPKLAEKIGLNEAIALQQLHYWLNKSDNRRDGVKWVYNSYPTWKEQFQFWSIPTIQRIFKRLEMLGLIKVGNFNKMKGDLTKWYTVDYDGVAALETSTLTRERASYQNDTPSYQNDTKVISKCDDAPYQNDMTITRDYTRDYTETSSMPPAPVSSKDKEPGELPRRPLTSQSDLIADYFARLINSDKDSLTRSEYIAINQLVGEGFTLDRCRAGIDSAVNGIRGRGQVVSSFLACVRSIRQLDPKTAQPLPIQQYQKTAPFEQTKKAFNPEEQKLTPIQQRILDEKRERYLAEEAEFAASKERRRLERLAQTQPLTAASNQPVRLQA